MFERVKPLAAPKMSTETKEYLAAIRHASAYRTFRWAIRMATVLMILIGTVKVFISLVYLTGMVVGLPVLGSYEMSLKRLLIGLGMIIAAIILGGLMQMIADIADSVAELGRRSGGADDADKRGTEKVD